MRQAIYETLGRAREFSELALNLFGQCDHGCLYCYVPLALHKSRGAFANSPVIYPRLTVQDIEKSASVWQAKGETRRVLLCFTCDPYMHAESETKITRRAIEILHAHNLNVTILTKGGLRATRDFDLLTPKDAFAVTLTCLDNKDSEFWEPSAAYPTERMKALHEAHRLGIETWVSLEPMLYHHDVSEIIRETHSFTGHYKLGCLNYTGTLPAEAHSRLDPYDHADFGFRTKVLLDKLGTRYYFKRDLLKEMGIKPEDFKQTWICR